MVDAKGVTNAIAIKAAFSAEVLGGRVFAYGDVIATNDAAYPGAVILMGSPGREPTITSNGVVIAWDNKNSPPDGYEVGAENDIKILPEGAKAIWNKDPLTPDSNGISYSSVNGVNSGFIDLMDINVSGNGIKFPDAPTDVHATAGNGGAVVSFTPPTNDGGSPIIGYTVTSNHGGFSASGASSPITITGLKSGTTYTFTVRARNLIGFGDPSEPSNSVTISGGMMTRPSTETTIPGSSGAPWNNPFADVSESDWFFEAVQFVRQQGLMTGTSATTFNPNAAMTRGMMVTVLHRMAGSPPYDPAGGFSDVTTGTWYTDAVTWAVANGIVSGYGDGLFGPNDDITREQMAVILYNYAIFMNIELPSIRTGAFTDDAQISDWAKEAVNAMYEAGIINGKGGGVFNPLAGATRAEVATILMRFLEEIVNL
jgi:hypothetical protein